MNSSKISSEDMESSQNSDTLEDSSNGLDNLGAITEDETVGQLPVANGKFDTVELNKVHSTRSSISWGNGVKAVRF